MVLAALLAGAAVLAADVPAPVLHSVVTVRSGAGQFELHDGTLYGMFGEPASAVVAYDLPSGRRRWGYGPAPGIVEVSPLDRITLVSPRLCVRPGDFHTTGFDPVTGRLRWRQPGVPVYAGAGLVILNRPLAGDGCDGTGGIGLDLTGEWTGRDLTTGEPRWTLRVPDGTRGLLPTEPGGRWLFLVAPDGGTTSYQLETGQPVVTRRLPVPPGAPTGPAPPGSAAPGPLALSPVGDDLVAAARDGTGGGVTVLAFDGRTLATRWSARVEPPARGGGLDPPDGAPQPYRCGPLLCLDAAESIGLDPGTGRVRWRGPGVHALWDRYGIRRTGPALVPSSTVVDLGTGRVLIELPGRELKAWLPERKQLVVSIVAGGRTWFELVDLPGARSTPLGWAPGWYGDCRASDRYLACQAGGARVAVWRLPD